MDFAGENVIGIIGATATGKSGLAMKIAEMADCEIVSADSVQIYNGLDIGSNKPTKEERIKVKHHLIDIVSPNDYFSANDYADKARKAISEIILNGKIPIMVGGTGFYFYTLFCGSDFNESFDSKKREELNDILNEKGAGALYALLEEIDAESAAVIHPNNVKRVMRAIEIFYSEGIKKSQGTGLKSGEEFRKKMPFLFQITLEREGLYDRINKRVDEMVSNGLIDEVLALLGYVKPSAQSLQAIGYKEIIKYLNGFCSKDDAILAVKQNTRNYAKRQLTYFKRLNPILLDGTKDYTELAQSIIKITRTTLLPSSRK